VTSMVCGPRVRTARYSPGGGREAPERYDDHPDRETKLAHQAAPKSWDGRAGQSHGVVSAVAVPILVQTEQSDEHIAGRTYPSRPPPSQAAHNSPIPVSPAVLRRTSRLPPARWAR